MNYRAKPDCRPALLGFSNMTYDPNSLVPDYQTNPLPNIDPASGVVIPYKPGYTPDTTYIMDELTITGDSTQKKFPWWILILIAAGTYYSQR